jgi:hypothetical protein
MVMSASHAMVLGMDDGEKAARLAGLLAMLALPMVRGREGRYERRMIEAEVSPGKWAAIQGAAIEADRLILWSGTNGSRVQYEFRSSEGCPRWRTERPGVSRYMIDDEPWSER